MIDRWIDWLFTEPLFPVRPHSGDEALIVGLFAAVFVIRRIIGDWGGAIWAKVRGEAVPLTKSRARLENVGEECDEEEQKLLDWERDLSYREGAAAARIDLYRSLITEAADDRV